MKTHKLLCLSKLVKEDLGRASEFTNVCVRKGGGGGKRETTKAGAMFRFSMEGLLEDFGKHTQDDDDV